MIKIVKRRVLSWIEETYLPQIFSSLKITFLNMFRHRITLEYPEQKSIISKGYRGMPVLLKGLNGHEKCVACQLCEFICPPKAIRITPSEIDNVSQYSHTEKKPKKFEINMLRCIYCGMCEEVCPEEAIVLKDNFSLSGYSRQELIFNKYQLLDLGGENSNNLYNSKKDIII